MDVRLAGTGGLAGWPEPGCRCASCLRAATAGQDRAPGLVVIDDVISIGLGRPPEPAEPGQVASDQARHVVEALPGGWQITGADGGRLLLAAGPGQVPQPPPDAGPYDVALLDLLEQPAQLGALRAAGQVHARTSVALLCADHRVSSAAELTRRCDLWQVLLPADGQVLGSRSGSGRHSLDRAQGSHRTLILGGARSGKSREAELRLAGQPEVTYVAAGPWPDDSWLGEDGSRDAEWEHRVAAHRSARPRWWQTVETIDLAGLLRTHTGALLIDGIGTWLAAVLTQCGAWDSSAAHSSPAQASTAEASTADPAAAVAARIAELVEAWRQTRALVVAVTDQVGSGVVPATPAGRLFRDQLGWLNQRLAGESEDTVLVVAGRVVSLTS